MATTKSPAPHELLRETQRLAALRGHSDDKAAASVELAVAQVMYRAVKAIDATPTGTITQEQADRICAVIATRVVS